MLEESQGKTKLPSFLSTNPTDENRIQHIQSLIAKVMPAYKRSRNNY
jgi:predicted Zn-dependent protease